MENMMARVMLEGWVHLLFPCINFVLLVGLWVYTVHKLSKMNGKAKT